MSESNERRRWVGNQLESLYLAGLTHVAIESPEEEAAATGHAAPGSVQNTNVTPPHLENDQLQTDPSPMKSRSSQATRQNESARNIKIEPSWKTRLDGPFNAPYMASLLSLIHI